MSIPTVVFDGATCPGCSEVVRPFETVSYVPSASGMVVDQGLAERRRYEHCGQEWERIVQRPPRWSSSPGHGR